MNKETIVQARAPGRINIIGEHTDYNQGFVFPAAISLYTDTKLTLTGDDYKCHIYSETFDKSFTCDLRDLRVREVTWENYLVGVLAVLSQRGITLKGFDCRIVSTLPIGGGVSSSAALECSFIYALNALFDLGLDKIEMALICQEADHKYVGVMSGIMDQFTSMMGKKDHAVLLDCRSLEYSYHKIQLKDFSFFLLNTNVHHELASSEYNQRQIECRRAVSTVQSIHDNVESLRDITMDMLDSVRSNLDELSYNRSKHVIEENKRVEKSIQALETVNLIELGKLMYASHESLKSLYEVSCKELDFIVDQCKRFPSILGARMMGGGFGGCVLMLIKSDLIDEVGQSIMTEYKRQFGVTASPLRVELGDGVHLIQ